MLRALSFHSHLVSVRMQVRVRGREANTGREAESYSTVSLGSFLLFLLFLWYILDFLPFCYSPSLSVKHALVFIPTQNPLPLSRFHLGAQYHAYTRPSAPILPTQTVLGADWGAIIWNCRTRVM